MRSTAPSAPGSTRSSNHDPLSDAVNGAIRAWLDAIK